MTAVHFFIKVSKDMSPVSHFILKFSHLTPENLTETNNHQDTSPLAGTITKLTGKVTKLHTLKKKNILLIGIKSPKPNTEYIASHLSILKDNKLSECLTMCRLSEHRWTPRTSDVSL